MIVSKHSMPREELANTLTHGLGLIASVGGGVALITLTTLGGDSWQIFSAAVYSVALLLLYAASTVYHGVQHPRAKPWLELLDHCAIFVLIAGTYTPFTLVSLRGPWGWSLFGVIWGLALLGIVLKLLFIRRFHLLSTMLYIAMGWLVVVAAGPMIKAVPAATLSWLVAGGVAYTAGTIFYHNQRIPFAHAIWHLFVIAGSVCHFIAISSQLI